jgi:hypothetical protein
MVSEAVARLRRLSLSLAISFSAKAAFELASAAYLFSYILRNWGNASSIETIYLVLFFCLTEIWQLIAIMVLLRDRRQRSSSPNPTMQGSTTYVEDNLDIM